MAGASTTEYDCHWLSPDPETGCIQPRPCRDCLQKRGCLVGLYGGCQANPNPPSDLDYRHAIAQNLSLPAALANDDPSFLNTTQYWQFPALLTNYCPADDAICQRCIAMKFWVSPGFEADSRFCVGASGCVCISNCEFSTTTTATVSCDSPVVTAPSPVPSTTSSSSPPSPSTSECLYSTGRKSATDGPVRRSCASCLETTGCRIGTDGYCEPDSAISSSSNTTASPDPHDFHYAIASNVTLPATASTNTTALGESQSWRFPANQVSYCPSDDSVCETCIEARYWLREGAAIDSRFCIGANGCVCVANCGCSQNEALCRSTESDADNDRGGGSWGGTLMGVYVIPIVIAVVVVAKISALVWGLYRCHRKRTAARGKAQLLMRLQEEDPQTTGTGASVEAENEELTATGYTKMTEKKLSTVH